MGWCIELPPIALNQRARMRQASAALAEKM
jgi:hypothetical protein